MTTKYSKTRRIVLFVLSLMFVMTTCFAIMSSKDHANADEYQLIVSEEIGERYFEGETLKVPTAKFSNGAEEVTASTTIKFPNGSERIVEEIEFDMPGTYSIVHKAVAGGKVLTETIEFDVVEKLYGVDSIVGSSEIQEYFFDEPKFEDSTKKGLMTVIPAGASFVYNKVINLNGKTKDDILFNANIISSVDDRFDFMQFNIRLTDVYDPSNYVTLEMFCSSSDRAGTYMRASAACQGKATSNSHTERNQYGVYSFCSFGNRPSNNWYSRADDTVQFSFDYANQTLYGNRYPPTNGLNPIPVVSLNDTSRFSVMWDGFTTGEAILSVFPTLTDSAYESTKAVLTGAGQATILINSIDGDDVDTIGDNYSFVDNYYKDDVAPLLNVDLGEYTNETLPEAVVGYSYPVFPADTVDVGSGVRSFSTKVFLGYSTNNPTAVAVKNGSFTPIFPGNYTIEYKSVDYFGNVATKLIPIRCVPNAGFNIQLAEDGSDTFVTGNVIKIKTPSTIGHSGASLISAVVEGKNEAGEMTTYPINMNELTFVPMADGEFTVKYTAKDYVGREIGEQYVINVAKAEKPVFIDTPDFVKNFIQGFKYEIPVALAYDFYSNKLVDTKIYYSEGNGEEKELTGSSITPTINEDLEDYILRLRYVASAERDASLVEELVYEINCASVYANYEEGGQYVDRKLLFDVTDNVTVGYQPLDQNSSIEYSTYSASGDARLSYVNPLSAIDFSVYFSMFTNDFEEMVFTLTDVDNAENAIQLKVTKNDGASVKVEPTGGLQVVVKNMDFYHIAHLYNVKYHFETNAFQLADGADRFIVKKNLAGKDFTGFNSNKVYLDIDLLGVKADKTADLMITELNGFSLFDNDYYETRVLVKVDFDFVRPYHIDVETVIPKAVILDAVNAGIVSTLSLQSPSGNVVSTVDGIALNGVSTDNDYTVVFTEYGNYTLTYKVSGVGNIREIIRVEDIKRPVITVSDAIKSEVSVGTTVKLDATATDDSGKDTQIVLTVFDPDYHMQSLAVGTEFTFDTAGKYIVMFTVYDAAGNCTISRNVVKVK